MVRGQVYGPNARSRCTARGTTPCASIGVQDCVRTHSEPHPAQLKIRRGWPAAVSSAQRSPVADHTQIDWHGHISSDLGEAAAEGMEIIVPGAIVRVDRQRIRCDPKRSSSTRLRRISGS